MAPRSVRHRARGDAARDRRGSMGEPTSRCGHNEWVAGARRWEGSDVTVVIAAFNAAATLDQALASVAGQSVAPQMVVIADDCSTDATATIAEAWGERLAVQVLRLSENGGPAVARHRAIEQAVTPLVAILDSDDVWLPDHLETMLRSYATCPGVVSADSLPWIPGSTLTTRSFGQDHPLPAPNQLLAGLIRRNVVFVGTLMERDTYLGVGGFRAQFRGTEDWDLWIRMARAGVPITRPDHPTVLYRMASESLSARAGQLDADLAVVRSGLAEATDPLELRAFRARKRQLVAQGRLFDAYDAAGRGARWRARRLAARALRGQRRVALRAAAMLVAPRTVAGQREARRYQPRWWFRRL